MATLSHDAEGFTRAEGKDWYSKSQGDLQAMSSARKTLLQIDRQRREGARKFGDDSAMVTQIVGKMGKTETYVARRSAEPADSGGAVAAGTSSPMAVRLGGANAAGITGVMLSLRWIGQACFCPAWPYVGISDPPTRRP